ncbi:MAG: DUF1499 domain-containing protein [Gemmatimonadota bacterium]
MTSSRPPIIALAVAACALLLLFVSGIGYRQELWSLQMAFAMIKWAAYLGIAAALLALIGAAVTRPIGRATLLFGVAFVIAAGTAYWPWRWKQVASSVPPIHDVTTDTQDPPPFVAILPLRANARNSAVYGGDSIAALQRVGYPDLGPVTIAEPAGAAFTRALTAARAMGWEVVAVDSSDGRIEATATTRWFGFKDDVVVRVRDVENGSRVDVRSVSRVGGSDVGTNAARIRAFLAQLQR